MSADERLAAVLARAVFAHAGEICHDRDCGEGFGYDDCGSIEERRRGCAHIAEMLVPLIAEHEAALLDRLAAAEATAEKCRSRAETAEKVLAVAQAALARVEKVADEWSIPESHRSGAWLRERDAGDRIRAALAPTEETT